MASEGAENKNYQPPGGQFNVPDQLLSLENFTKGSPPQDASFDEDDGEDQVRDGIYNKTDKEAPETITAATTTAAAGIDVAQSKPELKLSDLVERYDPTKPMALLKLFGDLIITHEATTLMKDTRIASADATKGKPPALDEDHVSNGNEKTQLAFASLSKHVPAQSDILDRVMQTLDRLTRQTPSQFDNTSEIV